MMNPAQHPEFDAHEQVVFVGDEAAGYAGIIAVHSTHLGPAAGGCRIWSNTPEAALTDVLRLARGMSYKNAMADLPLGGGKAVIYEMGADRTATMEKFGEAVEALGGTYVTAEDVGATVQDMRTIATRTAYVAGFPKEAGRAGGDPSPATSLGVFVAIEALLGGDVAGKRVAVQGVGAVGFGLVKLLREHGARVVVADIGQERVQRAVALGAEAVSVDDIHKVQADLYSPCALGAGLNARTIPELGAPMVCGAANNQLETPADDDRLVARGILYAPDFVVNAGGIINVSAEYLGEPADVVDARVRAIPSRLMLVLEESKRSGQAPGAVAERMAQKKIGR